VRGERGGNGSGRRIICADGLSGGGRQQDDYFLLEKRFELLGTHEQKGKQ